VNVLVDTSVWHLALRRKSHKLNPEEGLHVHGLTELITEGRAKIIGLIRQEILSGIKNFAQFENFVSTCVLFRMSRSAPPTTSWLRA